MFGISEIVSGTSMQSVILNHGCALSRLRCATHGCALSRLRCATHGCALSRLRSATDGCALSRLRSVRARLESALGERISSPFTDLDRRVFESVPTGIASLDALTGGLPRGAITEIFGPPSSGRTSTMVSILAEAIARDEVCALVDGNDAFDPKSAASAGLELNRLLWVRCHKLDQVLKSTDLLLQGGGFGRVVMDLTDLPLSHMRSIPLASWFRFQRTIEKTPTVLLVVSSESVVQSAAALVLRMEMRAAEWSTVLNGLNLNVEVIRSRRRMGARGRGGCPQSYVRVHLHSQCIW
jgi:recombination protein RecA